MEQDDGSAFAQPVERELRAAESGEELGANLPSRLREGSGMGLCEVGHDTYLPTPSPSRKREGNYSGTLPVALIHFSLSAS